MRVCPFLTFLVALLCVGTQHGDAAPPAPPGDPAFWASQYDGLVALRNADYPAAIKAFTSALQRTPDFSVRLQRAVAYALSGDYDAAYDDLGRARIPNSREPELWRISIWAASGKEPPSAGGDRGQNWFSGIPGHLVQGRDDYDTSYASCVAYEWAQQAYALRMQERKIPPAVITAAAQKAARWFANRNLATAPMATFSYQAARQLLEKDRLADALQAINLARTMYPFDGDIRLVSAEIDRCLGRPESARREYTIALTMSTNSAPAYRGRALAAAAEGDQKRAKADLEAATRYDPKASGDVSKAVAALLAQSPVRDQPAVILAKLDAAAATGDPPAKLLPLAMDLQRASVSARTRYDEIYQDRLRELEDTVRARPNDPAAHVAVGSYILDELANRGEQVEPRRSMQFYRYQYSQTAEIVRAAASLDIALKLDPRNVPALVRKAYAFDAVNQTGDAEQCINKVLQLVGAANAQAIRLLAEYRSQQAGRLMARASYLRTPTFTSNSWTERRSDGIYEVTQTIRHDPTAADLQNAAAADQQARRIINEAKSLMADAIKQNPDSLDGLLLRAQYERWFGTADQALAILRQAARNFPASLGAQDALVDFYMLHRMPDDATKQRLVASRLYQTTAAPLLERIWSRIPQTGWEMLLPDLEQARQVDPADARATAYLAFAQADVRQEARSAAAMKVAIALELARLKLDEQGAGAQLPRASEDFALPMRLLELQAGAALRAGQVPQALTDYQLAAGFASRFASGGNGQLMFNAMIPDGRADPLPAPTPVNGATLAAGIYYGEGQTLNRMGKNAEAIACFRAVAGLARSRPPGTPKVGNGRGESNYNDEATGPVVVGAMIEVARWHLGRNEIEAARLVLQDAGEAKPTRAQSGEMNDLQMQIGRRMQDQPW